MLSKLSASSLLAVLAAAFFGRLSTAIAQLVAAFYLTPTDFGIYATATGVIIVTTIFRGGGTGNHVQTMKTSEFANDGGRFFRYAMAASGLGLLITAMCAWPTARWYAQHNGYSEKTLVWIIGILALNYVLFNSAWYARSRMISEMRLKEISALDTLLGAVKLASTWALAALGTGPIALAAPVGICSLFENGWTWSRSGIRLKELRVQPGWLGRTFVELKLPLVMAVLTTLNNQTDSLVGSVFVPVAMLGSYFFASQLAVQPTTIVGATLKSVFTAAASQIRGDSGRESFALRVLFNGAMVFIPIVSMIIPAVFVPLEMACWGGKWADSQWPLFLLSATMVYPTALLLVSAPVAAMRDWNLAIRIDLVRALPKIVAAALAGVAIMYWNLGASSSGIVLAASVGGLSGLISSLKLIRIMTRAGQSRSTILYELYSTPMVAVLSAIAAIGLAQSIADPLKSLLEPRPAAFIEAIVAGTIYTALSMVLVRFGYTVTLVRVIASLPQTIRPVAYRVFLLKPSGRAFTQ